MQVSLQLHSLQCVHLISCHTFNLLCDMMALRQETAIFCLLDAMAYCLGVLTSKDLNIYVILQHHIIRHLDRWENFMHMVGLAQSINFTVCYFRQKTSTDIEDLPPASGVEEAFCDSCSMKGNTKMSARVFCTPCAMKFCAKHEQVGVS